MLLTGISVALGFLRDASIAALFGASSASDAYFAAFLIVNILYQVLISGALVPAFLPVFSQSLAKEQLEDARTVACSSINILAVILVVIAVFFFFSSDFVARIIAPGFSQETSAQVSLLLRILSPGIIFLSLAGLVSAQLNSLDHFVIPSLSTGFVSLGILLSIVVLGARWGALGLAAGALLGMIGQLIFQLPFLKRKVKYRLVFDFSHPDIKRIARLTLPLLLYLAVAQSSTIVERVFASTLTTGTVSWLSYAQKVTSFPNTLFTSAVLVALFPALSRSSARNLPEEFEENLWRGIRLTSFLIIPSAIFLAAASQKIVGILYERGQFSTADTQYTAILVTIYAIGVIPSAIGMILARAFHARQNMKTPLWVGIANTVVYAGLAATLSKALGMVGLALSLSISAIVSMLILGTRLHKATRFLQWKPMITLIKITTAATAGTLVFILLNSLLPMPAKSSHLLVQILDLVAKLGVGGLVYLTVCVLLNAEPARWYLQSTLTMVRIVGLKVFAKIGRADGKG